MYHRKDASLDTLARSGNVAQFVSYEPAADGAPVQTFSRLAGLTINHAFGSVRDAVEALMARAPDGSVNVRSYTPESPRSREFLYGLTCVEEVESALQRLAAEGSHVIVNETVDINDGGVSGVMQGGVIEFAPDDTPRCVEKPGVASMPLELGLRLLETVYGFRPDLPHTDGRVEFSVHPRARGWQSSRTLLWELEETPSAPATAHLTWPNRFSRHLGDKAYGLLMAHLAGLPVPSAIAIARRVAPFTFGEPVEGAGDTWVRTCPREQEPGLYTTTKGWTDPFALLAEEDPENGRIASVLLQSGVPASYSGAALIDVNGEVVVEGVAGEGDLLMLGSKPRETVPATVGVDVVRTIERLRDTFGPTRIEWVHDGSQVWVLQLHLGATLSSSTVLVPGDACEWVEFDALEGLERLRQRLATLPQGSGLRLVGQVGMTSHVADLVRKAGIPTRIVEAPYH